MNEKETWLSSGAPNNQGATSDNINRRERLILLIVENKIFEQALVELLRAIGIKFETIQQDWTDRMEEREVNFLEDIKVNIISSKKYTHIICIADANENTANTQLSFIKTAIQTAYSQREQNSPAMTMEQKNSGYICYVPQYDLPKTGIWIMPNNNTKGTFADFYLKAAIIDPTLEHRLDSVLKSNEKDKLVKYKQNNVTRNLVKYLTFMAWQKDPMQVSTKQLFKDNCFDKQADLFQDFQSWLKEIIK